MSVPPVPPSKVASAADIKASESDVYDFLTQLYFYQDELSWNRIQTIVAIEGGILVAVLSQQNRICALLVLSGTIVIWLIWRLVLRDWQLRDHNLTILEAAHARFAVKIDIPASPHWFRGRYILKGVVWVMMITNVVIFTAIVCPPVRQLAAKWLAG